MIVLASAIDPVQENPEHLLSQTITRLHPLSAAVQGRPVSRDSVDQLVELLKHALLVISVYFTQANGLVYLLDTLFAQSTELLLAFSLLVFVSTCFDIAFSPIVPLKNATLSGGCKAPRQC